MKMTERQFRQLWQYLGHQATTGVHWGKAKGEGKWRWTRLPKRKARP